MKKRKLPKPTDGELAILSVLWRRGPRTVREVHSEFNETRETGYTTVLKMLQIMAEKGLVTLPLLFSSFPARTPASRAASR